MRHVVGHRSKTESASPFFPWGERGYGWSSFLYFVKKNFFFSLDGVNCPKVEIPKKLKIQNGQLTLKTS